MVSVLVTAVTILLFGDASKYKGTFPQFGFTGPDLESLGSELLVKFRSNPTILMLGYRSGFRSGCRSLAFGKHPPPPTQ